MNHCAAEPDGVYDAVIKALYDIISPCQHEFNNLKISFRIDVQFTLPPAVGASRGKIHIAFPSLREVLKSQKVHVRVLKTSSD